jgi:hypothetical protein
MYDLLARIAPDGSDLIAHVLEECDDESDVLSQLAAIQFVHDHGMDDLQHFIRLLHQNIDNPLTGASIAQACVGMLVKAPDHDAYIETVATLVDHATGSSPDLLGALAPLAGVETFGRFLLASAPFQMWLFEIPHNADLRTFNVYMRTLLTKWADSPVELLLPERSLLAALTNPHPGLRTATFEHIAAMAPHARERILAIERLPQRICDGHMDSSADDVIARRKAMDALGIRVTVVRAPRDDTDANGAGDAGPDLMTI